MLLRMWKNWNPCILLKGMKKLSSCGKQSTVLQKLNSITINPRISLLIAYPKELKTDIPNKYTFLYIHNSSTSNSLKTDTV